MAELIRKHADIIISYHEHDSLLENVIDERLTEAEQKAAWKEYKNAQSRPPGTKKNVKKRWLILFFFIHIYFSHISIYFTISPTYFCIWL